MAEATIKDLSYSNVGNANIVVGSTVILDLTNSTEQVLAYKLPTGTSQQPLGVVVDDTKLDSAGAVVKGAGQTVRSWGKATCIAVGAIAIGDHVQISGTAGRVATVAQAGAGAQPVPVVGIAHSIATNAGDPVEVFLTIGSTW